MKCRYLIQKSLAFLLFIWSAGQSVNVHAQNGWKRMEDMNMERMFHGSCLLENSIYVFGSNTPLKPDLASVEVYDIGTNEWASLANMPKPIGDPHVCGINLRIYLIGGWVNESDNQNASNFNLEYNPEQDGYTERKNCPFSTASSPSCVLNNKIHVFGNRKTETVPWLPQKNVFIYDPVADNWDSLPDMKFEHTDGDAVSLNNKIYLMGGAIEKISRDTAYFFVEGKSEMYDHETKSWTIVKDMPVPVARHASVVHDNKILVFGGDSADYIWGTFHGTNLIQEYDPLTDTWQAMEGMPFNRFASTAHKAGDFVYLIGGYDNTHQILKEVWRFDLHYLKPTSANELLNRTSTIFTLRQNYPNPFSGSTRIRYEIAEPGVVDLDIVNGLGQEIITLDHGIKIPGSYSVTWDAKGIGSGFYFCRLKVGEAEKVMKLVVLP
jgi:N-acetylneuraminic acid mutarotase